MKAALSPPVLRENFWDQMLVTYPEMDEIHLCLIPTQCLSHSILRRTELPWYFKHQVCAVEMRKQGVALGISNHSGFVDMYVRVCIQGMEYNVSYHRA